MNCLYRVMPPTPSRSRTGLIAEQRAVIDAHRRMCSYDVTHQNGSMPDRSLVACFHSGAFSNRSVVPFVRSIDALNTVQDPFMSENVEPQLHGAVPDRCSN